MNSCSSGSRRPSASRNGPRCSRRRSHAGISWKRRRADACVPGRGGHRPTDDRRYRALVLDSLFGGSLTRVSFQEIREKRGLVYSVYSFSSMYQETGLTGLYFGCRPERMEAVMETVGRELQRLVSEPVTAPVAAGRGASPGPLDPGSGEHFQPHDPLGKGVLTNTEILSLDELAARIEAVTPEQVLELVFRVLTRPERLSVVGIGSDRDRSKVCVRPTAWPASPVIESEESPRVSARRPSSKPPCAARWDAWAALRARPSWPTAGLESGRRRGHRFRGRRRPVAGTGKDFSDLEAALEAVDVDVLVDYTIPASVRANILVALEQRVAVVVGTTGLGPADLSEIDKACERQGDAGAGGPELRHGRGAHDGVRQAGGPALQRLRDRRVAPRQEARCALGHLAADPPAGGRG